MPSASGGSGPMSWKACEPAWRQGWRCTISVSGSTSNLVVLGWLSLICWSGDLNSHQAFKQAVCHNQVALGSGAVELDAQLGELGRNGLCELNEAHVLVGRSVTFFVGAVF